MTEIPRQNYCVGLSSPGRVKEIFNSDSTNYSEPVTLKTIH